MKKTDRTGTNASEYDQGHFKTWKNEIQGWNPKDRVRVLGLLSAHSAMKDDLLGGNKVMEGTGWMLFLWRVMLFKGFDYITKKGARARERQVHTQTRAQTHLAQETKWDFRCTEYIHFSFFSFYQSGIFICSTKQQRRQLAFDAKSPPSKVEEK